MLTAISIPIIVPNDWDGGIQFEKNIKNLVQK